MFFSAVFIWEMIWDRKWMSLNGFENKLGVVFFKKFRYDCEYIWKQFLWKFVRDLIDVIY